MLWEAARDAGEQVRAFRPRRSTLEEVFLDALGGTADADLRPGLPALARPARRPGHALAADHPAWRRRRPAQQMAARRSSSRAIWPPLLLVIFLVVWGLFEQKSTFLTPFLLFLIQDLPEELKAGPARVSGRPIWTAGVPPVLRHPALLPDDPRAPGRARPDQPGPAVQCHPAVPVAAGPAVRVLPGQAGGDRDLPSARSPSCRCCVGFRGGYAFSLDPSVIRRHGAGPGGVAGLRRDRRGLGRAVDAGLLLAVEELPIRGRDVAGLLVDQLGHGGRAGEHRGAEWCPLASYTNNINRIRDALLDAGPAWDRLASLGEMGRREVRSPMGMGPFGPGRRTRAGEDAVRRGPGPRRPRRCPGGGPGPRGAGRLSLAVVGLRAGRPGGGVRAGAGDAGPGARSATMRPRAGYRLQMTNDK